MFVDEVGQVVDFVVYSPVVSNAIIYALSFSPRGGAFVQYVPLGGIGNQKFPNLFIPIHISISVLSSQFEFSG